MSVNGEIYTAGKHFTLTALTNSTSASQPGQQPDNGGYIEDCLQIYHSAANNGWNDSPCYKHNPFICSWRICPGLICPNCVGIEIFAAHPTTDIGLSTTTPNNTDEDKDPDAGKESFHLILTS